MNDDDPRRSTATSDVEMSNVRKTSSEQDQTGSTDQSSQKDDRPRVFQPELSSGQCCPFTETTLFLLEDTEPLLNALMLLSTFLLAFSAGTPTEYSYSDILEIDVQAINNANNGGKDVVNLTGTVVLRAFLLSTTLLMVALSIGVGCYLSLSLSFSRKSPAVFHRWIRWHQFPIIIGYICFICGTVAYVIAIRILLEAVFPQWCVDGESFKNKDFSYYALFVNLSYVFNTTSQKTMQLDGSEKLLKSKPAAFGTFHHEFDKYVIEWNGRKCYSVNSNVASYYKKLMISSMIGTIVLLVILGIIIRYSSVINAWVRTYFCTPVCHSHRDASVQSSTDELLRVISTSMTPRSNTPTKAAPPEGGTRKVQNINTQARIDDEANALSRAELDIFDLMELKDHVLYLDQVLRDAGISSPGRRLRLIRAIQNNAKETQEGNTTE